MHWKHRDQRQQLIITIVDQNSQFQRITFGFFKTPSSQQFLNKFMGFLITYWKLINYQCGHAVNTFMRHRSDRIFSLINDKHRPNSIIRPNSVHYTPISIRFWTHPPLLRSVESIIHCAPDVVYRSRITSRNQFSNLSENT